MSKKVIILGGGESGIGAALLAKAKGYDYLLSDSGMIAEQYKQEILKENLVYEEGGHSMEEMLSAELVIKSPGIPDHVAVVKAAIQEGIPVISEIEFAYRHIAPTKKIVAITGTNGKTTTTLLTYHLLKSAGLSVGLGGNIGKSFARLAVEDAHDFYVLEISSFQLDGIETFRPDVAVLLNITPDHLDRYANSFEKYVASKFHIIRNMGSEQALIYFNDSDTIVEELGRRNVEASLFAISVTNTHEKQGGYFANDHLVFNYKEKIERIPQTEITLIGKHNLVNTMAAVLSALCMEAPLPNIVSGLKSFKNAPHRLEYCGKLGEVTFVNDSKATNVDAVYYALEGIQSKIIWLAGGVDKGNEYDTIAPWVKKKVRSIICIGKNDKKIEEAFAGVVPLHKQHAMDDAVAEAYQLAKPGDVVLLSPACASFDFYKNYMDRGDCFKSAVARLMSDFDHAKKIVS